MSLFDAAPPKTSKGRIVRPSEDRRKTLKRAAPGEGQHFEYFKQYRLANAEAIAARKAEWRERNLPAVRVYQRTWRRIKNAGKVGNFARGESNRYAKLTDAQVLEMRSRYAAGGVSLARLAAEYGVAQARVWKIVNGLAWTHLLPRAGGVS